MNRQTPTLLRNLAAVESDQQPRESACPADILKEFDPAPSHQVMSKVRYFFYPYNCKLGFAKHMEFEDGTNHSLKM